MTNLWRFLDTGVNSAYYNMALDEALLMCSEKTGYPVLRLYDWSSPSVTLGYFQKVERSLNLDFCKKEGIDIVRRITGGRGVYHSKDLTYSIIIPQNCKFFKLNNLELYKELSGCLLMGLQKLGVKGKLQKPDKVKNGYQNKSNCFNATSVYEITVKGKKIVGSAQRWSGIGVIQQGSILLDFDKEISCKVFNSQNNRNYEENGFITILEALGFIPKRDIVIDAIKGGFEEVLSIEFTVSELGDFELEAARNLLISKYTDAEWNFSRK